MKKSARGFSLVESLLVVAISSALITIGALATVGLLRSGRVNTEITQVMGMMERARLYAVANNTYTWVIFSRNSNAPEGAPKIYMTIVASKDGTDPTSGFVSGGTVAADKYQLLERIVPLSQLNLESAGANRWAGLPEATAAVDLADNAVTFVTTSPVTGTITFNKVVQFNPAGEARVSPALTSLIEIGLSPVKSTGAAQNMAVVRIAGMTGATRLYRP